MRERVEHPFSPEPSEAYLTLKSGERVQCLIEKMGPLEWQLVPVRNVALVEIASSDVDLIPAGGTISFILDEEEEDE
jgi:hypothetical protein